MATNDARKRIHQHLSFQERDDVDGGYSYCTACGEKVMLITALSTWRVDREAYRAGERTDASDDVPDEVDIGEEITAHWCNKCEVITSLSFNSF